MCHRISTKAGRDAIQDYRVFQTDQPSSKVSGRPFSLRYFTSDVNGAGFIGSQGFRIVMVAAHRNTRIRIS
jgi:hypothetical protein